MHADFWHQKWENGDIGFHESEVNPALENHLAQLQLPKAARIFVPLCGKSNDIIWLLQQGYRVVGAELSSLAVADLFTSLGRPPRITQHGPLSLYQAENIDLWVGDIFALSSPLLDQVDAIYDRAALVALPAETRRDYARLLVNLSGAAPQLLVCYEYDQALHPAPPFAVKASEVQQLYGDHYRPLRLSQQPLANGLRGSIPASITSWLLQRPVR